MKKTILSLGLMLVSALALTNCTKNEEVVTPLLSVPFELFAGIETRTTNDGLSTEWAANDNISVFNAAAGTTTYSANNEFKTVEGDGNFTDAEGNGAEAVVPLENNKAWISAVASALRGALQNEGVLAAAGGGAVVNNYNFNQVNNSPKPLDRLQIYRDTQDLINLTKGAKG